MKNYRLLLIVMLTFNTSYISAQLIPEVSITSVLVDGSDFSKMEVHYDLLSDATDSVSVHVLHSIDGGLNFIPVTSLTGDFGKPVLEGSRVLSYESASAATQLEDIRVKISAVSRFSPSIADMVSQVQIPNLLETIIALEGERNYSTNPTRMNSIKDYLDGEMAALLHVERLGFSFGPIDGENFVSDKAGLIHPKSVAINGAHFDGVMGAPAADDNASGTAGVIEAARILSQYQFENSIRFLLFDLEELGLRGSIDYVTYDLSPEDSLLGVIVNEMIAYSDSSANSQQFPAGFSFLFPDAYNEVASDSFRGNFITNVGNTSSSPLMANYKNAAQEYVPVLKVVNVETPGNSQTVQDLRRSDHAPFWDAGHQALMITDGANFRNPNYHEASDSLSTLDLSFMKTVVQANVATLASLAVPINAGSDTSAFTAILGIDDVDNRSTECFSLQSNSSGKSQTAVYHVKSCELIQEYDIIVTDLSGRMVSKASASKVSDYQIDVKFQYKATAVYIIHGTIDGKPFSERVMR